MTADPLTLLIAFCVVVGIIVAYVLIEKQVTKQKRSADLVRRVSSADDLFMGGQKTMEEEEEEKSGIALMLDNVLMLIFPLLGKTLDDELDATKKKMMYAGIRSINAPSYFLFFQYVIAVFLVLIALPILLKGTMEDLVTGGIILIIAIWGPKLFLQNAIDKRKKVLTRSFPDALDLLLVCVESGLAMDAAFSRVCSELGAAHPDITEEFNRTRLELSLLSDRGKALYNMGERTNITAFKALAAALVQTEKFGTSLADTLRVMSDDFRQTRLMEAENIANRLPALMTIPLITMLLPALFIIILAPAIMGVAAQGGLFGGGEGGE